MIAVKSNLNELNKKRHSFCSIGLNYKLVGSLFVCWMLAFLSLSKGIQSLGKVSYVTAIFRKFTGSIKIFSSKSFKINLSYFLAYIMIM